MDEMTRFAQRKSTRLADFDYAGNYYYFVTICTHEKKCIFGTPEQLNAFGEIAKQDMLDLAAHYEGISIEPFVIMPNHVHAILVMQQTDLQNRRWTLDQIIGSYKSGVSRKIRKIKPDRQVWQRSFHDHIIRNQKSYETIYRYIQFNPQKWEKDCFYPKM